MDAQQPVGSVSKRWLRWVLALGCGAVSLAVASPPSAPSTAAISVITLERDCFGCASGSVLTLRRDGTALLHTTGKSRQGTVDKTARGAVRLEDFEHLARLALAQGFFALNDSYEEPDVHDGAWVATSITRSGQDKRVFRRDAAGPAPLKAVEAAIEALKARIDFSADHR